MKPCENRDFLFTEAASCGAFRGGLMCEKNNTIVDYLFILSTHNFEFGLLNQELSSTE